LERLTVFTPPSPRRLRIIAPQNPRKPLRRSEPGFTLLELLVLLLILGLAALLILPRFSGSREKLAENSLLRDLESKIRYAQYHAVLENKRYLFRYDRDKKEYGILREPDESTGESWVAPPGSWGKFNSVTEPLKLTVRKKNDILFLPDGSASESEILVLKNNRDIASLRLGKTLGRIEIRRKNS